MKHLLLTKGYVAVVDDEDFDYLNQWKWSAQISGRSVYAKRQQRINGKPHTFLMHREILQPGPGLLTDHIDGNGLNNTRANLRVATKMQNGQNQRPQDKPGKKFKGVGFRRGCPNKPWFAYLMNRDKYIYLGSFPSELEAAKAYDLKAKELFGEYACLNFNQEVS